jgi:hypothetical protein
MENAQNPFRKYVVEAIGPTRETTLHDQLIVFYFQKDIFTIRGYRFK